MSVLIEQKLTFFYIFNDLEPGEKTLITNKKTDLRCILKLNKDKLKEGMHIRLWVIPLSELRDSELNALAVAAASG